GFANVQVCDRNVALAAFESADLLAELLLSFATRHELDTLVDRLAVQPLFVCFDLHATLAGRAQGAEERFESGSRTQVEIRAESAVLLVCVALTISLSFGEPHGLLQLAYPASALALERHLNSCPLSCEPIHFCLMRFELLLRLVLLEAETLDGLVDEPDAVLGKPCAKRIAGAPPLGGRLLERLQFFASRNERVEHCDLIARAKDCIVRPVQILEVADERANAILGIVALEHVMAHEFGEIADRLHRDGLIEELERLRVRYTELTAHVS